MKQREEEKTKNIQRKRKKSSSVSKSASSCLHADIISQILLRLPVTSLLKFRSVSKIWSSIVTNPYFNNLFETRTQPNLLLFFKEDDRFFVSTIPQHNPHPNESYSYSSSQPIDSFWINFPKYCASTIKTDSVHGLICFQKTLTNLLLWNPTTRKFLLISLHKPDDTWTYVIFFLGYDPVEGKHKLMYMSRRKNSDECRILTLGSDKESWRTVKTNHIHYPTTRYSSASYGPCICINGVLYYGANMDSDQVIMSFDVRSETFNAIKLPWKDRNWHVMMISYEGKLGCLGYTDKNNSLLVWVLEDAKKHEWSSRKFLTLAHYDRGSESLYKLIGMTKDGELIYVPKTVHEAFHVLYIDPMRQSFRKVEYRGILDKDSRLRHGLGDKPLRGIQFFPNHIETLISL